MSVLVLHHFPLSPFAEKIRMVLGAKGLAWLSVTVPMLMPKPDVVALTGGYRRTPFLQIGADVYCDTALICRTLDRLAPQLPLYPPDHGALAEIIAQWADSALFWVAVPFTSQPASRPYLFPDASPEFIQAVFADRAAMAPHVRRPAPADAQAQLHTYLSRLEQLLAGGQPFLLGAQPCIADFSAAHPLWYVLRSPPAATVLDAYPKVLSWHARMRAFGHGRYSEIRSADAIALAASAPHRAATTVEPGLGFAAGDLVRVMPADYAQDPVLGQVVGLSRSEIVVSRTDPRAGRVQVHFPRIGYEVAAQP